MAHLTIDTWLFELQVVWLEASSLRIAQLTGVTHCANRLIAGGAIELFPRAQISPFASRHIDNSPVIDPLSLQRAVLDGENVNLAVRQLCCVRLLKFGTDRVVHGIAVPRAVRLLDIEIVPAITSNHVGK